MYLLDMILGWNKFNTQLQLTSHIKTSKSTKLSKYKVDFTLKVGKRFLTLKHYEFENP